MAIYEVHKECRTGCTPRPLILTEHVNATYFISFHFAALRLVESNALSFAVLSEKSLSRRDPRKFAKKIFRNFQPTALVFSRFGISEGAAFVDEARLADIPVIYHIDDDLLAIPDSQGSLVTQRHNDRSRIDARRQLLGAADLIYASTDRLKQALSEQFPGKDSFSGMYAPYFDLPQNRAGDGDRFTIGYMGSKGHLDDLDLIEEPLLQIMSRRPEVHFETFGTIRMPNRLGQLDGRTRSHGVKKDYWSFINHLSALEWDLAVAPLQSTAFNLCKAPTKFIEYTSAGLPVAASDIPVYSEIIPERGGVLVPDDGWECALNNLINKRESLQEYAGVAREQISKTFSLDRLSRQLLDVLSYVERSSAA